MRAAIIVGLLLVYRTGQPAEIYRCTDQEGAVTFSQTRCALDARRIDLPDRPWSDRETSPETRSTPAAIPETARIGRNRAEAERTNLREERARRERMRIMAIEADRWGRNALRNRITDEETFRGSTQQRR
ncbi:DUF4124 domain-containing protein [Thiocapsa marina]|uniref:DUF4124 domain-containing protein n=1 Tax=Thiocapsa marina 5811 TaxID=768671 RepID=F9U8C2_9GAMM|nr:DUF4124 domain-containing protein [Thiocapsa marina]EGV19534.1 hypothetical protein ThimaDRAFT_0980 [Thiocapsa marina 5811]